MPALDQDLRALIGKDQGSASCTDQSNFRPVDEAAVGVVRRLEHSQKEMVLSEE